MELDSFNESLACVCTSLMMSEIMAGHQGGPIAPELCLHSTLGWLAGGLHLDTCDIAGISTSSFHRVIWKTVAAMIRCPQLAMHFPSSSHEIELAIQGFESTSFGEAIENCALVVDGHSMRIRTLVAADVGNVSSHFQGHNQGW